MVVHGQIILNQFKHFPNKAVQKAAFVGELRSKMETRKHSKLYMSKVSKVWACICVDVRMGHTRVVAPASSDDPCN